MMFQKRVLSCIPALTGQSIRRRRLGLSLALLMGVVNIACAKDAPVAAVMLFDGAQGAAYVQITGVTLNGKMEVRLCDGFPKFNKSVYNGLPRAPLKEAASLQRGADGVLTLTVNDKPLCAVPSNLKFDQKPEFTPAEAAEQAVVQGTPLSFTGTAIPPLKPGVQLVFVEAPDVELADFLQAQRAKTIQNWQEFVSRYPSSNHLASAQNSLAGLHQQSADAAFKQYETGKQDLAVLRQAYTEAEAANQASPGYSAASQLLDAIDHEIDTLLQADRAHLQAFRKALEDHAPGNSQLTAARQHVNQLVQVRPDYPPVLNFRREIGAEERKLENAIATAQSLAASGRYDDAVTSLGPYTAFASEMSRVEGILNADYRYYFEMGQQRAAHQDWQQAVTEFRKATVLRSDSKQAENALNNATTQLSAQRDQQAANLALLESNDYASKGQVVEAYDVLADLPEKQRSLVAQQLADLAQNYVSAATKRAQKLQETHIPIKGRADADAAREAYLLLDRASSLSGDPAITLKRDFLSSKISAYYLDQADRYLQKPSGAGAGVGWLYLLEAQRYGVTNLDSLKDQMARYASLYQRRARLSLGITLRDLTARRDNPAFANQLADAVANAVESSGASVDLVRQPSDAADAQPNFMFVGEILEHRVVKNTSLASPESKYRAGTHETRNPAWLKAQNDFDSAQQQLTSARQALADAQSHKKKDIIAEANDQLQEAQKRADDLRKKLDSIDQNRIEVLVEPYHYTKKSVDLTASIEIEFRITDRSGNSTNQPLDVQKNNHRSVVVIRDVKAEDTEGITNQGMEPDETQFLTDLEIDARDALVSQVRQMAAALPAKILQEARTHAQQGDPDGAAERYIVYLNSTPQTAAPERDEAVQFLREQFNLAEPAASTL
jgi:hypothetical protein